MSVYCELHRNTETKAINISLEAKAKEQQELLLCLFVCRLYVLVTFVCLHIKKSERI